MFYRIRILLCAFSLPAFAGSSARGIENFHQVDSNVYRGAQPSTEGFAYLASLGVKTVVDLREADARSAAEERIVAANGMKYVNVPMTGLTPPTDSEINRILAILDSGDTVFVHCKRGADRTGAIIAAYRIDHDGWDNTRALKEAMGSGMSFFQFPRQAYIRAFQPRTVDARNTSVRDGAAPYANADVVRQPTVDVGPVVAR
jgi:protein-tyrosine phosphatase